MTTGVTCFSASAVSAYAADDSAATATSRARCAPENPEAFAPSQLGGDVPVPAETDEEKSKSSSPNALNGSPTQMAPTAPMSCAAHATVTGL